MTTSDAIDPRRRVHDLLRQSRRAAGDSRAHLDVALLAAWQLGHVLRTERERVRRNMGRSAWPNWLAANFPDTQKAALRCMRLAGSISDARDLSGLSLRLTYFRLGIPIEPKVRRRAGDRSPLPAYLRNAQRLLLDVRSRLGMRHTDAAARGRLRKDLFPLHRQLAALFTES